MRLVRSAGVTAQLMLWATLVGLATPLSRVRSQTTRADAPDGAIVGRILDERGSPVSGATVAALAMRSDQGIEALDTVTSSKTDELGQFRLSGLAPGLYYVTAANLVDSITTPKGPIPYPPTYAPGTALADEARPVAVSGSGPPARVEFRLWLVPPATVSGRLVAFDAKPLLNGTVTILPVESEGAPVGTPADITVLPDGRFTVADVPPGHYRIRARGQTQSGPALFGIFTAVVNGRDVAGIRMTLRPGGTLDGTVVIEAAPRTAGPARSSLMVRAPFTNGDTFGDVPTGIVRPDGRFVIGGLMTGPHQVIVDGLPAAWVVKRISAHGTDLTDVAIDVAEGQAFHDVRVTITNVSSDVTGIVRDATGDIVPNATVLVFSAEPAFWMRTSRRLKATATDQEGRFRFTGLPAGNYLAIASLTIDERDLGRRDRLQSLARVATPMKLDTDDAQAAVDLRLTSASDATITQ